MVQAVLWMAALSLLLIVLVVPVTVHLLRAVLVADESPEAERQPRARDRESPRQGGTGT